MPIKPNINYGKSKLVQGLPGIGIGERHSTDQCGSAHWARGQDNDRYRSEQFRRQTVGYGRRDVAVLRVCHDDGELLGSGLDAVGEVGGLDLLHLADVEVDGVGEDMVDGVEPVAGSSEDYGSLERNYGNFFHG